VEWCEVINRFQIKFGIGRFQIVKKGLLLATLKTLNCRGPLPVQKKSGPKKRRTRIKEERIARENKPERMEGIRVH